MTMKLHSLSLILILPLLLTLGCSPEQGTPKVNGGVSLRFLKEAPGTPPCLEVVGLKPATLAELAKSERQAEQWAEILAVYVVKEGQDQPAGQPPVLGAYRIVNGSLRFEPRFPLQPGVRYRAVFNPEELPKAGIDRPITLEYFVPKPPPGPATFVQHVYPSTDALPENQLKFYIHFSAPMSRGEAYRRVHLLDAAGKKIEWAFLELGEELWSPDGKRFTLFFDPGRIKRGLKPREELGPALEEGKSYTFVIDHHWCDANGNPLKDSFRKSFRVGPPDDEPVDPKAWKLQPPVAGTTDPLTVTFPEPIDHAMLGRVVWVLDAAGQRLPGTITVSKRETCWQYTPEKVWPAGSYHLVAETTLEDLAGNSIGKPFEVDVFHPIQREVKGETAQVPFEVRGR